MMANKLRFHAHECAAEWGSRRGTGGMCENTEVMSCSGIPRTGSSPGRGGWEAGPH